MNDVGVAELLPPRNRPPPGAMHESELSLQDIPKPAEHGEKFQHDLKDPDNSKFYVATSLVPDAGHGLFAKRLLKGDTLLCQYYGRKCPTDPSDKYTIRPPGIDSTDHSQDIDAYDPASNRVLCLAGFVNDPLDETMENARWEYINGKLYLRATRDIRPKEQIFAHYGYEYWAWLSDQWTLPLQLQIIRRYFTAVNLTDPVWRRLPNFLTLWRTVHGHAPIPPGFVDNASLPPRISHKVASTSLDICSSSFIDKTGSTTTKDNINTTGDSATAPTAKPNSTQAGTQLPPNQTVSTPVTTHHPTKANHKEHEVFSIFRTRPLLTSTSHLPDITNDQYDTKLLLTQQTNIPEAGNGVQIIKGVKTGTILGLYLNHPNIRRVTESRIRNPRNLSEYAVEF